MVLDSTGIKVTNRGEWLPHKWNIRKGYLKIHVAVDIKKATAASEYKNNFSSKEYNLEPST
jgi:hypothetical protein